MPDRLPSRRRVTRRRVTFGLAAGLAGGSAWAQSYPSRVIKIIVPFPAGGQPDVVARLFAQHLTTALGANVVDNRPGGSTAIGSKAAATAEPDGYTVLFGSVTSLAIAPALIPNVGYDPVTSFAPIIAVSRAPMCMIVGPSVKAGSIAELIAFAKANPGKLNFAAPTGTPPHLAGEAFRRAAGVEIVPVFYRTMNQAFTDLLAGQMDIIFDSPAALAHLLREGKVRALVTLSDKRIAQYADVPTMSESGLPDLRMVTWNGFVAPAGTPDAVVRRLNAVLNEALRSEPIRTALANFGSEPLGGTPEAFSAFVAAEAKKWADLIRLSGVKLN